MTGAANIAGVCLAVLTCSVIKAHPKEVFELVGRPGDQPPDSDALPRQVQLQVRAIEN